MVLAQQIDHVQQHIKPNTGWNGMLRDGTSTNFTPAEDCRQYSHMGCCDSSNEIHADATTAQQ